jgi:L-lactate utilization protein LutB
MALCAVQTKSYFIVLDWGRDELVQEWVRALLQCIK